MCPNEKAHLRGAVSASSGAAGYAISSRN